MKKKLLAILLCVALIASLAVGLAACNKDDEPAKASNAETLGTAVAMVANTAVGSASAAESEDNAEAGVNLTVSATGLGSIAEGVINTAVSTVKPVISATLQNAVTSVECFVNENGVKVETLAKDNEEYIEGSECTLKVSVTYANEAEKTVTDVYYLAVDANGADIEGTASFDFTIGVYTKDAEGNLNAVIAGGISGKATYSEEIDGLKFGFSADVLGLASAEINAYATKSGTIGIDVNAGAGVEGLGADVNVNIELGKLADNKYGATVTANASVTVVAVGAVNASVKVDVVAEKTETSHDFAIDGVAEVKLIPSAGDDNYVAKANISGKATYNVEEDEFVVSVSGNANFVSETKESK